MSGRTYYMGGMDSKVFVIRVWHEEAVENGEIVLRCLLERPDTGQRSGFTNTEALLEALHAELTTDQASRTRDDDVGNVGGLLIAPQPA